MANLFDWVNERAPNLAPTFRKHMTEYYAPKNMQIPPYNFIDDTTIQIGVDPKGAA